MSKIPFTVIGGYLGAGKTTLLNQMLKQSEGRRIALLVNDFGEINIDAGLIESETDAQINLTNGCVCCTMIDGFYTAVDDLVSMTPRPDHIVVEASGVADVNNLAQYGYGHDLALDGVLVVADATSIRRQADDKYVAQTIRRQLRAADLILLNKTDLVTEQQSTEVQAWLLQSFPETRLLKTRFGDVPLTALLGAHMESDRGEQSLASEHQHRHQHEHYQSWLFATEQAVSLSGLEAFLQSLPDAVLRLKGVVVLATGEQQLVQCVGRRKEITQYVGAAQTTQLVAIGLEALLDVAALDRAAADLLISE